MRIVIDMQGAQTGSRFRGIGRYTLSFVRALIKNKQHHEIILFLSALNNDTIDAIQNEFYLLVDEIKICYIPVPVYEMDKNNLWRLKASEKIREDMLYNLNPDFVLITTLFEGFGEDFVCSINELYKIPTAVIFYDAIPLINEEIYLADTNVRKWYNNKIIQCQNAQLLLSISNSAKDEAIKYIKFNPDNVINISTASDDRFYKYNISKKQKLVIRNKFKLSDNFLMYSGATDDRKNHLRLIEAFSLLPIEVKRQYQLVIVGGMPDDHKIKFYTHAKKYNLSNHEFLLTGKVSDEEMNIFYNMCTAFIFPSWHEGFGLPALEAMKCGKAVIASNTSSLPEVIGREDALFDPFNVNDISQKINKVLSDTSFRKSLEKHSYIQVKKFTWDLTARKAIFAMENFHKHNKKPPKKKDKLIQSIGAINRNCTDNDIAITSNCIFKNRHKKTLYVDISELVKTDHNTGVQRVTKNILNELLISQVEGFQVVPVFATETEKYSSAYNYIQNKFNIIESKINDEPISFLTGDIFLCLDMSPPINIAQKHFYQKMKNNGVNVYFLVFDILPLLHPNWWHDGVATNFKQWISLGLESNGVICISKSVKEELENWATKNKFIKNKDFFSWFHLGANIDKTIFKQTSNNYSKSILDQIKSNLSFLMVGTLEPRKGHKQTLKAFEKLWAEGIDIILIIVGKEGWLVDDLIKKLKNHSELNKRLFWLDGISDEYLEKVYNTSTCLIAASEGEGFGLPLIEAAQKKKPIIARDIPVFKEVSREFAYYFENDNSPLVLANAIKEWLALYRVDKHPKSDKMPWLTWKESTEQLLDCLDFNLNPEENK